MNKKQPEPKRDYTQAEQNESFIGRRLGAFANRSRDPGDGATWATVLGAFMWTLLIICYSVADQPLVALVTLMLMLIWVGIMARFGKVNVASILWGSATSDAKNPPNEMIVFQTTLAVALFSLVAMLIDAARGWNFGWYGVALIVTVAVYLAVYIRAWLQVVR